MGLKKPGRNDLCPCGSGKKYKQCCLKTEPAPVANDRAEAVPKAFQWLTARYDQPVRAAIDDGFFGGLTDAEYETLANQHRDAFDGIMANAMEWLLADGYLALQGRERRVADLVLGRGGPLLSVEQRHWLEGLIAAPLGLYEVSEVAPGESLCLRDVLFPERAPVLVREKSGSRQVVKFDLLAARIVPVEDHFLLSGAGYAIPRQHGAALIAELQCELEGVAPDSPDAKAILGTILPHYWLKQFLTPFEMPRLVDQVTGEPILLITDHYRVRDWKALDRALSAEADVEGNRAEGWSRVFEGQDGLWRRSVAIAPGSRPDRLKLSYRTQGYADTGRPWFESVAGPAVVFVSRELSDPRSLLARPRSSPVPAPSTPAQIPPEALTQIIEASIHQHYADWADRPLPALADQTPREAIKTPEGLEQVKFLLRTYEHGEARQARDQNRPPVSYDFLWRELGIQP